MKDTYSEIIMCPNCSRVNCVNIPKGITVEAFKQNEVCFNCGCSLQSDKMDSSDMPF